MRLLPPMVPGAGAGQAGFCRRCEIPLAGLAGEAAVSLPVGWEHLRGGGGIRPWPHRHNLLGKCFPMSVALSGIQTSQLSALLKADSFLLISQPGRGNKA